MPGIDESDDGIKPECLSYFVVYEERLRDRCWICQTSCFNEYVVELVLPLHQVSQDADQVAADRAADTAVVHFEDFLVSLNYEFVIDTNFAVLIFDDGDALAVLATEDSIKQGGLTCSEEAGKHGDGHALERERDLVI